MHRLSTGKERPLENAFSFYSDNVNNYISPNKCLEMREDKVFIWIIAYCFYDCQTDTRVYDNGHQVKLNLPNGHQIVSKE